VLFYVLGAPVNLRHGQPSNCIMKIVEYCDAHKRYLTLDLPTDSSGRIVEIIVELTSCLPPSNVVRKVKVARHTFRGRDSETGRMKIYEAPDENLTLMDILHKCSEKILQGTTGDKLQFYLNFLECLELRCLLARGGEIRLRNAFERYLHYTPKIVHQCA
jgi:hypothetical protein